ncbi:hypothetical protein FA10DRAFT_16304 [Acaromyces ingoldii]|uniref:Uncharacterized protein n=1 Tax=Acaromyces ingoldii TaxID=215250 RepID=A0A316YWR0_9BASI|nr:hypothetical protein FA10DRAFT_16304 [Acaromyces ingoldii]PWN93214.1 hypothetical protein FA10DRAFT_16304 [Acaromyces ingoldii]
MPGEGPFGEEFTRDLSSSMASSSSRSASELSESSTGPPKVFSRFNLMFEGVGMARRKGVNSEWISLIATTETMQEMNKRNIIREVSTTELWSNSKDAMRSHFYFLGSFAKNFLVYYAQEGEFIKYGIVCLVDKPPKIVEVLEKEPNFDPEQQQMIVKIDEWDQGLSKLKKKLKISKNGQAIIRTTLEAFERGFAKAHDHFKEFQHYSAFTIKRSPRYLYIHLKRDLRQEYNEKIKRKIFYDLSELVEEETAKTGVETVKEEPEICGSVQQDLKHQIDPTITGKVHQMRPSFAAR